MEPSPFRCSTHIPTQTCITLAHGDAFDLLQQIPDGSIHAVVTDPPYGLDEYYPTQVSKLRSRRGGLWRQPPRGRAPLPRFTVLSQSDRDAVAERMCRLAVELERILVPGGHLVIAANPLLSSRVFSAVEQSGLEKRGEIVRIVRTLRGGGRRKNSESEFPDISVMPRAQFEPWRLFRKRPAGTIADNLRVYGAGGLRRVSDSLPFSDVIESAPAGRNERAQAPHPSLKPQAFMRQIVRAVYRWAALSWTHSQGAGRPWRLPPLSELTPSALSVTQSSTGWLFGLCRCLPLWRHRAGKGGSK